MEGIFQIRKMINLRQLCSFTTVLNQSCPKQRNEKDHIVIYLHSSCLAVFCVRASTRSSGNKKQDLYQKLEYDFLKDRSVVKQQTRKNQMPPASGSLGFSFVLL